MKIESGVISVILPTYNESEGISDLIQKIHGELDDIGRPFEILVIDDGS
jgi:glycosyltransferase involved in cell wall biosynthesis